MISHTLDSLSNGFIYDTASSVSTVSASSNLINSTGLTSSTELKNFKSEQCSVSSTTSTPTSPSPTSPFSSSNSSYSTNSLQIGSSIGNGLFSVDNILNASAANNSYQANSSLLPINDYTTSAPLHQYHYYYENNNFANTHYDPIYKVNKCEVNTPSIQEKCDEDTDKDLINSNYQIKTEMMAMNQVSNLLNNGLTEQVNQVASKQPLSNCKFSWITL